MKTNKYSVLYQAIIAVFPVIHTKHINVRRWQNLEIFHARCGDVQRNQYVLKS
jgi:hypothetical protein